MQKSHPSENIADLVHEKSIEILQDVGFCVPDENVLARLESAGFIVDMDSQMVRIESDLLDAALRGAAAAGAVIERIDLVDLDISPCVECRRCESTASCANSGDDMPEIYGRVREVDAIVLASPVFFMGVSAQTKAMIDRCQCFWTERFAMGKRAYEGRRRPKGLFVSCAGSPKPTIFEPSLHIVRAFFSALDYEYVGQVLLGHTDDPDLAPRKAMALAEAEAAGRKLLL